VSILWMMIGVAFYAFTIGIITSVLDRIDTKESQLNEKLETIDLFCAEAKIPMDLKRKIKEALEYHSNKNAFSVIQQKHKAVFKDLPIHIRYEVAMQIHDGVIGRLPFFQAKESTFVANLVPLLSPLRVEASEYIYMKGDHPYEIYFICSGRVNFLMDIGECVFKAWPRGAYFGDIEIIFGKRRICSAKSAPDTHCDLFTLNKKHYQTMIHNDYPDIDRELRATAQERELRLTRAHKKANEVLAAIGIEVGGGEEAVLTESEVRSNIKRKQSLVSQSRTSDHPGTVAAKQKISRSFHEVASGSKSIMSHSRRSLVSSNLFSEEFESS
jgi:CRP-like cAMP-binding protein